MFYFKDQSNVHQIIDRKTIASIHHQKHYITNISYILSYVLNI